MEHVMWLYSDLNHVLFICVIFRLKALQIYMDINNVTAGQIKCQLRRLKCMQIWYLVSLLIYNLLVYTVDFSGDFWKLARGVEYAEFNLFLKVFSLFIFIPIDIYLICMGIKM